MPKNSKPTLLFLHGQRGSHEGLRYIYENLEKDFNILAPDLPGYGNNPPAKHPSINATIDWLHRYTKKLPSKPILVGHSMGAIVASNFAFKYPNDSATPIILMSPIFRQPSKQLFYKFTYLLLRIAFLPFTPNFRYKILSSRKVSWIISHFLTTDKSKQALIDQEHFTYSECFTSSASLLADIKTSMTHEVKIPENKTPLLIIGSEDQLVSVKLAKKRATEHQIPIKIIPETGHLINYEVPKKVAKIIRDFLA